MAADSDKTMMRLIGLVLLVGGVGFAYWGYQMSHSLTSEFTRAVNRIRCGCYHSGLYQGVAQCRFPLLGDYRLGTVAVLATPLSAQIQSGQAHYLTLVLKPEWGKFRGQVT